jgi:phosphohistidine swiveling domain-containing protein
VVEPANPKILKHLKELVNLIYVDRPSTQRKAHQKLGATFASDYLEGYFETYESNDYGVWYIDYSPTLGEMYSDVTVRTKAAKTLGIAGQTGSPGKAKGPVRIVHPDGVDGDFPKGAVLVCDVTTPNYVPLMQKASAIVTDQGGILSHAAIVARELKKPCIVGTGNATKKLKNGQIVSVDADSGSVTVIR